MNLFNGAGDRSRTCDLRITNALLYQLSYTGVERNLSAERMPINWVRWLSQEPAILPRADVVHELQVILALVLAVDEDELAAQLVLHHFVAGHCRHRGQHVLGEADAAAAVLIQ